MVGSYGKEIMDRKQEPITCRTCKKKIIPNDLENHYRQKHRLQYSILQGQLAFFDKENGLYSEEDALNDVTSVHATKRRLQKRE